MTIPVAPAKRRGDFNEAGEPAQVPCFQCGVCCTKYQVRLTYIEARRIADGLAVSFDEFLDTYIDPSASWENSYLLKRPNGACVFLKQVEPGNRFICSIHALKPSPCFLVNASLFKKDCQDGLRSQWGLSITTDGQPAGLEEPLRRFKDFLKTLQ